MAINYNACIFRLLGARDCEGRRVHGKPRLLSSCRNSAICEYLSTNLPYKLSPDDVYITSRCTQAIEVAISILASPNANILVPRPGFLIYELCAAFRNVEICHFNHLPENGWEVNLDVVDALADQNTIAIVIINPGNPCIAETAKKHRIVVIADEVYGHLAFGANPFVPMGVFGSMVPVLTLGSLSKRWIVPGWRLGWFTVERLKKYFDICGGPATFIQGAVPRILKETSEAFFTRTLNMLKYTSDLCVNKIKDIPCLTCPTKPQGSMAMMVKLSIPLLKDIKDDIDFFFKPPKKESVILLPGDTSKTISAFTHVKICKLLITFFFILQTILQILLRERYQRNCRRDDSIHQRIQYQGQFRIII
ncbi:putative aminotransferase, class I/classII, tyrosine/nicotianamine aminotransferase [Helianthus debilis subsp. tardiflorus]